MVGTMEKIKDKLHIGHGHHGHHGRVDETGYTGYTEPAAHGGNYAGTSAPGTGATVVAQQTEVYETAGQPGYNQGYTGQATQMAAQPMAQQEFVEVEDRPVMKERVEQVVEHHPVEKRYVVETRPVGERELHERTSVESAGVTERIIGGGATAMSSGAEAPYNPVNAAQQGYGTGGVTSGMGHHHGHHHHGREGGALP